MKPTKLSDLRLGQSLKLLLFGDPGTGKTRMAASAHLVDEMRPVLYGDAEGGLLSLIKDKRFNDLDVFPLTSPEQNSNHVLDRVEELFDIAQDGFYKTVVIDTLSEIQRYGLMNLSEQLPGWQAYRKPKRISLPAYGANLVQTGVLVRAFRDISVNVIMTAHVRRAHLETDGHNYIVPSVTGQQWKEVMVAFDEVFFLRTKAAVSMKDPEKGVRYSAITKPFDNIKAKDRHLGLPVFIDVTNKTLEDILQWQS